MTKKLFTTSLLVLTVIATTVLAKAEKIHHTDEYLPYNGDWYYDSVLTDRISDQKFPGLQGGVCSYTVINVCSRSLFSDSMPYPGSTLPVVSINLADNMPTCIEVNFVYYNKSMQVSMNNNFSLDQSHSTIHSSGEAPVVSTDASAGDPWMIVNPLCAGIWGFISADAPTSDAFYHVYTDSERSSYYSKVVFTPSFTGETTLYYSTVSSAHMAWRSWYPQWIPEREITLAIPIKVVRKL